MYNEEWKLVDSQTSLSLLGKSYIIQWTLEIFCINCTMVNILKVPFPSTKSLFSVRDYEGLCGYLANIEKAKINKSNVCPSSEKSHLPRNLLLRSSNYSPKTPWIIFHNKYKIQNISRLTIIWIVAKNLSSQKSNSDAETPSKISRTARGWVVWKESNRLPLHRLGP